MTEKNMLYVRPASLNEALALKEQYAEKAQFLLGGDFQPKLREGLEVLIDLQDAGMDEALCDEEGLKIGGLATLKTLEECLDLPDFSEALSVEYGLNVRNTLSLSNFFAHTNGRSPVLTCLLALGATVRLLETRKAIPLLSYLGERSLNEIVIEVVLPEPINLAFESVGRSPKDLPIVCVAAATSEDGAINIAVGGTEEIKPGFKVQTVDEDEAAEIKLLLADSRDQWASAEYRQEVGAVLLSRALQKLNLQAVLQEAR
jgi:CO/xanthine dehydrogenase FAD-binding subunit